ncbi:hypothetical protein YQE_10404, partial [Dendroctonus ponderosae]
MSANLPVWKTERNVDSRKLEFNWVATVDHPLKNVVVTERIPRRVLGSAPSTGRSTPISAAANISEPLALALKKLDPLTEFAMREELDPLSKIAAEMDAVDSLSAKKEPSKKADEKRDKTDSWTSRKSGILQKYTTSEKLSMVTSFLLEGEKVRAQSTKVDKVQHRLEQLDSFEEGPQRKLDLSQAEYLLKIQQLNKQAILIRLSQRVKALKIAIQCAKMLADSDVLPFYPSKFVLVTDILDCFGKLVYERLRAKAVYYKPGGKTPVALPEDFTPDMVPDSAKETCLNWFFKIASIRELVPRLYVEMALLKSYYFISANECPEALFRLTEMILGIGNPLVAIYARCYLCRVGLNVMTRHSETGYLKRNFECFLETYQHLFGRSATGDLSRQNISIPIYMTLYTPALDYIMEAVVQHSPESVLSELLEECKRYSNSSLILNTIMSGFKPTYIAQRTLQFLCMIGQCTDDGIPLHSLLRTLGLCVSICPPPAEQRKPALNAVWSNIAQLKKPSEYMSCVEIWVQFIARNFSTREVNTVLGDVLDHMVPNRCSEKFPMQLKAIVRHIVAEITDFEALLSMDNFLPLIDLFHDESTKVEVCKLILTSNLVEQKTNDLVTINALMYLGGILHDCVNALTPEDEHRQIGDILCNIVNLVDYGRDFEQQLQFYVEARGSFASFDAVLAQLVQRVNLLAVNTRLVVKGLHTRKTGDFVRACAAYCFITIPSIDSTKVRLSLYLLSGQVALSNHCLGQADACFRAILSVISELTPSADTEACLLPFVRKFLAVLLVVPDNPDRGILSVSKKLLNVLKNFGWSSANLCSIYINVIDLLAVMAQEVYPYHIDRVESNDALWGSEPGFIEETENMIAIIIGEILSLLKELGPSRKQTHLAIELFVRIMTRAGETGTPF